MTDEDPPPPLYDPTDEVIAMHGNAVKTASWCESSLLLQLRLIAFGSKINILYICIPIAFLCVWLEAGAAPIFIFCFLALVPLAAVLGDFTEDLALRTSDVVGAFINVTFGNATELIISFAALKEKKYDLIKMSLAGSVLGNMLLVLGTILIASGSMKSCVKFNQQAAQTYMSSLILSTFAFLIPSIFHTIINDGSDDPHCTLAISQTFSFLLIITYIAYLFFTIKTHKTLFEDVVEIPAAVLKVSSVSKRTSVVSISKSTDENDFSLVNERTSNNIRRASEEIYEVDENTPQFSFLFAFIGMGVVAIIISIISALLVESVSGAARDLKLGKHFISIVLIPIVGNVAEHASGVLVARKGKVDIAIAISLGSSIQIAMFAMPITVIVSMIGGLRLDMNISPLAAGCLFVSVLLVHCVLGSGSSTWLSGAKLVVAYLFISVAFLHVPDN